MMHLALKLSFSLSFQFNSKHCLKNIFHSRFWFNRVVPIVFASSVPIVVVSFVSTVIASLVSTFIALCPNYRCPKSPHFEGKKIAMYYFIFLEKWAHLFICIFFTIILNYCSIYYLNFGMNTKKKVLIKH